MTPDPIPEILRPVLEALWGYATGYGSRQPLLDAIDVALAVETVEAVPPAEPEGLVRLGASTGADLRYRYPSAADAIPHGVSCEVYAAVPPAPPEPTVTERVPVWDAMINGRMCVTPDGKGLDCSKGDAILYLSGVGGTLMWDDAGHIEANRPIVSPDGTVEVLRENLAPESVPATKMVGCDICGHGGKT